MGKLEECLNPETNCTGIKIGIFLFDAKIYFPINASNYEL
jgi:hypothetical protein